MAIGVSNGQLANETTFDNAFMARNGDTGTVGKVDLSNTDPLSGANIVNLQKNINALASALGIPVNQVAGFLITWASSSVGLASSSSKDKIDALVGRFVGSAILAVDTIASATVTSYYFNTTGGALNFTLPDPTTKDDQEIEVKNTTFTGGADVNVSTPAGLVEGGASDSIPMGEYRKYKSKSGNWFVMNP